MSGLPEDMERKKDQLIEWLDMGIVPGGWQTGCNCGVDRRMEPVRDDQYDLSISGWLTICC